MTRNTSVLLIFIGIFFVLILCIPVAGSAYSINATAGDHGKMVPSGIQPGGTGFTIQAEPGYYIVMTFDGNELKYGDYYFFQPPNDFSNHNLSVKFAQYNGSLNINSYPLGASIFIDGESTSRGITPTIVHDIPEGPHVLRLTSPGYIDYTNYSVSVENGKTTNVPKIYLVENRTSPPIPTITPTITQTSNIAGPIGWLYSFIVPGMSALPNSNPTDDTIKQTNTTPTNRSQNMTTPGSPPVNLPPSNVIIFLFIALIPLVLLLVHDYLGLGHHSFPQPPSVRVGVAIGQIVCGLVLFYVISTIFPLPPSTDLSTLPLLIVLLFGAYLIFSALALAIGSILSRPLRWTLRVHVVVGVITLIVTPILLYVFAKGDLTLVIMPILFTMIAAPISALLALWQDHTLALQLHLYK